MTLCPLCVSCKLLFICEWSVLSHVRLFADPMDWSLPGISIHGFDKVLSGLPFPFQSLPNPGIESESFKSLPSAGDSLLEPSEKPIYL